LKTDPGTQKKYHLGRVERQSHLEVRKQEGKAGGKEGRGEMKTGGEDCKKRGNGRAQHKREKGHPIKKYV